MDDDEDKLELDDEKLNFAPFKDLCKRRFLWYYESYVNAIANVENGEKEQKVKDGQKFERMPFEGTGNTMDGVFHYPELKRRLALIKDTINQETDRWAAEGLTATKKESGNAANLQRQFDQVVDSYQNKKNYTCDISLEDGNPFVWNLTYFGRPMTHLDGGIFRIKISISPRFPEEQPRVMVLTKMFHHRISKDGVLCYFVRKPEEMKSHIETILEALEEEQPPYDPRTLVNPEAAKLYWGTPEEKKQYNRQLRRSVQRSME
jgi:ubiquitin-conjugating enzyme E2 Z